MEIKTTKRLVEIEDKVYIAQDGKEFATLKECEDYESNLENQSLLEAIALLELKELENLPPLDTDAQYISDNHIFKWYKVNTLEEFEMVRKAIEGNWGGWSAPVSYPETICVEIDDYDPNSTYMYKLSDMKNSTIGFWECFGLSVEFKKGESNEKN